MKILVDAHIGRLIAEFLEQSGHDVLKNVTPYLVINDGLKILKSFLYNHLNSFRQ